MGPYVHRELTFKWAVAVGFSPEDASTISLACIDFDRKKWTKPWAHFRLFGANIVSRLILRSARKRRSEVLLGYSIHAAQDAIGHGWILPFTHRPELDDWAAAAPEIQERIERATISILRSFQQQGKA